MAAAAASKMLGEDHSSDGSQSDWDDMGATHMVSHGSLVHGSVVSSPDAQPSSLSGAADPGPGHQPTHIGNSQPQAVTRDVHEKPGLGIDKARARGPAFERASVLDAGSSTASSFAGSRLPSVQAMAGPTRQPPFSHAGPVPDPTHYNSFQSSAASSTTASGQRLTTASHTTPVTPQAGRSEPAEPGQPTMSGQSLAAAYALSQYHNGRPAHTGLPAAIASDGTAIAPSTQRSMDLMATGTTAENRRTLSQRVASISAQVAAMLNADLMDPTTQRRMDLEMLTHGPGVETRVPRDPHAAARGSATAAGSLHKRAARHAQHGYRRMGSVEEDEQISRCASRGSEMQDSGNGSGSQTRGVPARHGRGRERVEGDSASSGSSGSHSHNHSGLLRGGSGSLPAPSPRPSDGAAPGVSTAPNIGPAMYNSLRTSGVWTGSGSSTSGTGGDSNTDSGGTAEYRRESTGIETPRADGNGASIDPRLNSSDPMGQEWSNGNEARQEWVGGNAGMGAWPDGVGGMAQWPISMQRTAVGSRSGGSQTQSDWPGMSRVASDWAGSEDGMSGWPDGHGGATNRPAQSQPEAGEGRPFPGYYSLAAQAAAQAAAGEYPMSWRPLAFQSAESRRMDDIDEGNEFPTLLELSAESMVATSPTTTAGELQAEDARTDARTTSRETVASAYEQGSAAAPDEDRAGPSGLPLPPPAAEGHQSQLAASARATVQHTPLSPMDMDAVAPEQPLPVAAKVKRQASFNLASSLTQFNAAYRPPAPAIPLVLPTASGPLMACAVPLPPRLSQSALPSPIVDQPCADPPSVPTPSSLALSPPPPAASSEAPEPPHASSLPLPALPAASSVSQLPMDAAAPQRPPLSPPVAAKVKRQASFNLASSLGQFNAAYRPPAPALPPPTVAQPLADPPHVPIPASLGLGLPPPSTSPEAPEPPHATSLPLPALPAACPLPLPLSPMDAAAPQQPPLSQPVSAKPKRQASFNLASSLGQFNAAYRPPAAALPSPTVAQPLTESPLHIPTPSSLSPVPPPHTASPKAREPSHEASMPLPALSAASPASALLGWGAPSRSGLLGLPGLHTGLQARGLAGTPSIGLHSMLEAFTTLRAGREVLSADAGLGSYSHPPGTTGLSGPVSSPLSHIHGPEWLVPDGDLHPGLRPGAASYTMLPATSSFAGPHMRPLSPPISNRLRPAYAPSAAAVIIGAGAPIPVPELLAPYQGSDAGQRRNAIEEEQPHVSSADLDPPYQHQQALSSPLGAPVSVAWEQQAQGPGVGIVAGPCDSATLSSISEPDAAAPQGDARSSQQQHERQQQHQQQAWQQQEQQHQQWRMDGQLPDTGAVQGDTWGMQPQRTLHAGGVGSSDGSRGQSGYMLQLQGLVEIQGPSSREKSQGSIVCEWPAQSGSRERLGSSRQQSSVRDIGTGGTPGTSGSFTDSGSVRRDRQAEAHSRQSGSADSRGEPSSHYKSSLVGGSSTIGDQAGSAYTATSKPPAAGCGTGPNVRYVCSTGPMNRTDSGIQELAQYLSSNSNSNSETFRAAEMLGLFKGLNAPTSSTDLPTTATSIQTAATIDIVAALTALGLDTTSPLALRYIQAAAGSQQAMHNQQAAAVASSASGDQKAVRDVRLASAKATTATWSDRLAVASVLRRATGHVTGQGLVRAAMAAVGAVAAAMMTAMSSSPPHSRADEPASLPAMQGTAADGPPARAHDGFLLSAPDKSQGTPQERPRHVSFDSWRTGPSITPSITRTHSQTTGSSQQQQPTEQLPAQQQQQRQSQEHHVPSRQASWELGSSGPWASASNASGSNNNSACNNLRQRPGSRAVSTSLQLTDSDVTGVAAWEPREGRGMHSGSETEVQQRLMGTGIERGVLRMCMLILLMCIGVLFLTIIH